MNIPEADRESAMDTEQLKDRRAQSRRRRSRFGSAPRAKIWLVVIFFAFRSVDFFNYLGFPGIDKSRLLGVIINHALLTTVLLGAVWYRQNWARSCLVILMCIGVVVNIVEITMYFPELLQAPALDYSAVALTLFCLPGLISAMIAWSLVYSRDIRRLTSRAYE